MEKGNKEIIKIAIVGAESTGKSTLCKELAQHYKTNFTIEMSRDYLINKKEVYNLEDVIEIDRLQMIEESMKIENSNKFLICDTSAVTSAVWSKFVFNEIPQKIESRIKKENVSLYLLLKNDIEWEFDPLREHPNQREEILQVHQEILKQYQKSFVLIGGQNEKRIKNAIEKIEFFFRS